MNIGQAIRMLRQKQGMSQTELAEKVGMSVNAVSAWELGKSEPPKGTTRRICEALGITDAQLKLTTIEEQELPLDIRFMYRRIRDRAIEEAKQQ